MGDLGNWSFPNLTSFSNINFSNNPLLTSVGNLGNWSFPNLRSLSELNFSNTALTDVGDLGMWNFPLLHTLVNINFSNTSLIDVGDLGNWNFQVTNSTQFGDINFSNNPELTNVGDLGNLSIDTQIMGGINLSNNPKLTTVGDLGNWVYTMPRIEFVQNIDLSNMPLLTSVGDLGNWGDLSNFRGVINIDISNNLSLTDVGDLGNWGNHSLDMIWDINISNNPQLTSVGDLGNWSNSPGIFSIDLIDFSNNSITDFGSWEQFVVDGHMPIINSDFSNNKLERFPIFDGLGNTGLDINFENQAITKYEKYANKHGMADGNITSIADFDLYNPLNYHTGEYGTYTFTPTLEQYNNNNNGDTNPLTIVGGKATLSNIFVGDSEVSYTIEPYYNSDRVGSYTVTHPLSWVDLSLTASDFTTNTAILTPTEIITLASASVAFTDESDVSSTPTPVIDAGQLSDFQNLVSGVGTYPLTFSYTYHDVIVSETINVIVSSVINPTDQEMIYANDFSIQLSDVNTANVIARANASGADTSTDPATSLGVVIDVSTPLPTTTGTYPIQFNTATGNTSTTVQMDVYDMIDGTLAMNANDFTGALFEVDTEAKIINKAGVKVFDITDSSSPIDVTSSHTINSSLTSLLVGVSSVLFTVATTSLTSIVNATITATNISLTGNDIVIDTATAAGITTSAELQTALGFSVTTINQGTVNVSIAPSDIALVNAATASSTPIPIVISVTDTAGDSTTATFNVLVVDNIVGNIAWIGTDFNIELSNVNDTNIITLSGVEAWDISGVPFQIPPTSILITHGITTTGSGQPVTFEASGETFTVNANVFDIIGATMAWSGHDFNITYSDINDDNIRAAASIEAWDISSTPVPIPPASINVSHGITTTGNAQTVGFEVNSETYSVNANVFDYYDASTEEGLNANDFTIALYDANNIGYKTESGVTGWNASNPSSPTPINPNDIAVIGTYIFPTIVTPPHSVTFVTVNGTTVSVMGEIIATNISLVATDITIDLATAQTINESGLLAAMGATATSIIPGPPTITIAASDVAQITDLTSAQPGGVAIPVTATLGADSTTRIINVYVYDVITGSIAWTGNDFNIELSDVNEANIRTLSGVEAWDISGIPFQVPGASITVNPTSMGIGNSQVVTFTTSGETYNVSANVFDIYDAANQEGLNANDFTVALYDVNNAGYKTAASVQGFNVSSGTPVPISLADINVDSSYIYPTTAVSAHPVTFTTVVGTAITVDVVVIDTNITLSANDLNLTLAQAQLITEGGIITLTGATATSTEPGTPVISVAASDVMALTSLTSPPASGITLTITATLGADSTTTAITVYVFDDIVGTVGWSGTDFNIELLNVNDPNIRALSEVDAWDLSGIPSQIPTANINVSHTITATGNTQVVTFEANGETYNVNANVFDYYDVANQEGLNANDFTVALYAANSSGYLSESNVQGFNVSSGTPVAISGITVDSSYTYPTSAAASHPVIFTTPAGTTITVQVTVLETNITLNANDFNLTLAQAQAINASGIVSNAGASASSTDAGTPLVNVSASEVLALTSLTTAMPTGVNITITATLGADSTSETITVYVYEDITGTVAWSGNDFNIELLQVNDPNIKALSNIEAWDISGVTPVHIPTASIVVTHGIVATGNAQVVTFEANGETYPVNANVFDNYNPSTQEGLTASDFTVALNDTNNAGYKTASGVTGWDVSGGVPVAINSADINVDGSYTYPTAAVAPHPVTFETLAGTTITVQATVIETNITLNANDFNLTLAQAQSITDGGIITQSGATATSTEPGTPIITIVASEVSNLTGLTSAQPTGVTVVITATLGTDTTTKTITVSVFDNITGTVAWSGNDFNIELLQVNDSNIKALSNIEAWDISSTPVQILPVSITVTHGITTTGNAQVVTFEANSLTYNVNANVFDIYNPSTQEGLTASDFTVALNDTNNAGYKTASGVTGWDVSGAIPVAINIADINVDGSYIYPTAAAAPHPVTFETLAGMTITVQATVIETNITLNANDFNLTLAQAQSITDGGIITQSGATATSTEPGTPIITVAASEVSNLTGLTSAQPTGVTVVITATLGTDATTKTITVSVFDTITGTVAWSGNDFNIELLQVNDPNIKALSNIEAWDISSTPVQISPASITVTHGITTTGNAQAVTFEANSLTYNVNANVFDYYDVTNQEGLNANDFTVALHNANSSNYLTLSGVTGWDVSGAVPVAIDGISVDSSYTYPTSIIPAHQVTFTTPAGTTISVQVTVVSTNITLTASDFTIDLATAQTITAGTIVSLAGASATSTEPGTPMINVAASEVTALTSLTNAMPTGVAITITATLGADTTTQIIHVNVFDNITGTVGWSGIDFNIGLNDVNDSDIRTAANIEAWDISGVTPVQIPTASITVGHTITAVGNGQAVMFTANGQNYNVNANVFDYYDASNQEGINAHDFTVPLYDANNSGYKTASGVTGWDVSGTIPIAINSADINVSGGYTYPTTAASAHPVTFVTNNGTTITVDVTVEETNITITASGFNLTLAQAQSILDTGIITQSGASATSIDPGTPTITIAPTEVTNLTGLTAAVPTGVTVVITATLGPDSATRTINVNVFDDIAGTVGWSGTDFNISLSDVNDNNIRTAANIEAWDVSSTPVQIPTPSIAVSHTITTVGNGQAVTFTANGQTYNVNANVFDSYNPTTQEGLNAHDFTVPLYDANNSGYKTASSVQGWDISSGTPTPISPTDINVDGSYTYPIVAQPAHPVTFITTSGTTITVNATVNASNITITANGFGITLAQAMAITDSGIITLSGASATSSDPGTPAITIAPSEVAKLTSLTTANATGVAIIITATLGADSTTRTINVNVFDNILGTVGWSGTDFNISLSDVNDTNIKQGANIAAWDVSSTPVQIPTTSITVTHSITTTGNGQLVTFTANGQTYNVNANVFDSFNSVTGEGLTANDFTLPLYDANNSGYKTASGVQGWDVSGGTPTPISLTDINVDSSYSYPTLATAPHPVTFVTNNGTTITVLGTITSTNITISANDFSLDLAGAQTITDTAIITIAGAVATSTDPGTPIITVAPSEVANLTSLTNAMPTGVAITITATLGLDSATTTVNVPVFDNILGTVGWSGNNFNIALSDITDTNIKTAANITAWDLSGATSTLIPMANITVNHSITTTGSAQAVTFTTNGQNYSVNANVFDTYNPVTLEGITANDFTVAVADANNLGYKNAANVNGWNATNPDNIIPIPITDINVVSSYIYPTTATPAHPVKFITTNGTEVEVNATVVTSNIAITANDYSINLATAQSSTETDILVAAGVTAVNTVTGVSATTNISASEVAKLTNLTTAEPNGVVINIDAVDGSDSASKAIRVYIFDNITTDIAWVGHDFHLALEDVNDTNILTQSGVVAWDITNPATPVIYQPLVITHTITTAGNGQPVTFTTGLESYTVNADIHTAGVVLPSNESIYANNFIIALADISEDNIKAYANVIAFDESTLPATPIALTDIAITSPLPTTIGVHNVTFALASGTNITVTAAVYNEFNIPAQEAISASGFAVELSEIATSDFKALANIQAMDTTDPTNPVDITTGVTITTPLPTITGLHQVTFTTATGLTSITVPVIVWENVPPTVDPTTNIILDATGFSIALTDNNNLTVADAITMAQVIAIETITGNDLTSSVTVDTDELALIQNTTTRAILPLTFIVTNGTTTVQKTVSVLIYQVVVPPVPTQLGLTAENYQLGLAHASDHTVTATKIMADVLAVDMATGTDLTNQVTVDMAELATINAATTVGSLPLTFTITQGATTLTQTITVTLIDDLAEYEILGNNFTISASELQQSIDKGTMEAEILARSDARAINKITEAETKDNLQVQVDLSAGIAYKTYDVEISYDLSLGNIVSNLSTQSFSTQTSATSVIITKNIALTVVPDSQVTGIIGGGLPATGESIQTTIITGLIIMGASLLTVLNQLTKKRIKK